LALRRGGAVAEQLRNIGVKVFVVGKKRGIDFSVLKVIRDIIDREGIVLIHSHNFSANFWGRIAGRFSSVPCIIATEHSLTSNKNYFQKKCDLILSKFTDCIIAVSEAVRRSHISGEHISPKKIITIYNGISLGDVGSIRPKHEVKKELGLNGSAPIVGIVGRLDRSKGHKFFLDAAGQIRRVFPEAKFIIVGDGKLKESLIELSRAYGLKDNVLFLGHREDRLDVMNIFDVAVLSSIREGMPISLLEYMALKKPIVATDVGGIPEVISDGISGSVVPAGSAELLAERIVHILLQKDVAERMGLQAYSHLVEKFTEDIMVKKIEEIYDGILRGKGL
jgi:glycosyltransferase involved in cell wall biosynthesis